MNRWTDPVEASPRRQGNSVGQIASPSKGLRLLDQIRAAIRVRHYSFRTEETYVHWVRRFILFHRKRHPREMGAPEVGEFLTHLAVKGHVASSTQNQALNAIVFLYRHVLECDLGDFAPFVRAKTPRRLPVVLAVPGVRALLSAMEGASLCMALLGYGAGLRVSEVMGLRIKDVDFHTRRIIVRQGKGGKDRVTPLPQTAFTFLKEQIRESRKLYDLDRRNGVPGVALPGALERKYPRAGTEWGWHFVFAARELSTDPRSGTVRRHHIQEAFFQRAVKEAARQARIARPVTPHTLRHCAVYPPRRTTHMLERGADIRTVQELIGHKDVSTTMIYTHVLNSPGLSVNSPADLLF